MSRFFSDKLIKLEEYAPGEQPGDKSYVKLNTNESPFAPSKGVIEAVSSKSQSLNLYCDPEANGLTEAVAAFYGVDKENVLMTNGSDEILEFAFFAFGGSGKKFVFPDLTYGFYPVFAKLSGVEYEEIPLKEDFGINVADYLNADANVVIANPNAPTGLAIAKSDIEKILQTNPDGVVIIDEAYVDFGGESCIDLVGKYDNLLVTRTFSKSFSLAGARLGFGIASKEIIDDLRKIKYSTNPYNVNSMTQAAGYSALKDSDYYLDNCKTIIKNREYLKNELVKRKFFVTDSQSNFLFVSHDRLSGKDYYLKLKELGVLVRHFNKQRIKDFVRITVGTREQVDILLAQTDKILGELL
ncbi:MAG: histidinol-phosphate transaminase [Christensenellaceae bacterium]